MTAIIPVCFKLIYLELKRHLCSKNADKIRPLNFINVSEKNIFNYRLMIYIFVIST